MTCRRCGTDTPRLTADQRYCPPCARDVDARSAPPAAPTFVPEWLRRSVARDETGLVR